MEDYRNYLIEVKHTKDNTLEAYMRDIKAFDNFLKSKGIMELKDAMNAHVVSYMMDLKNEGKTRSTINRKLASIRAYYKYLISCGVIKSNPTADIKSPQVERKELEFLSVEEVDKLLALPDNTIKGIRDKAMLELLYATGIRVTEIIELRLSDVNLRMGFVTCNGNHGKARIVPIGTMAKKAIDYYLMHSRDVLMRRGDSSDSRGYLFVNYTGEQFTRQGFWKIIKSYGDKTDFADKLTPQILRNSFAVHMAQNGADLKSLQELLGHEDISATQIYLTVTKNRIKDVYDKTHPRA